MKQIVLAFLCLTCSLLSFGQIKFEKGYFIDLDGKKTECQIRDNDWATNPHKFVYRLHEGAENKEADASMVKEFGVYGAYGFVKYVGGPVKVSPILDGSKPVAAGQEPEWTIEPLFLKVIVDGKASLYSYRKADIQGFFYSVDGSQPEQLSYKKYTTNGKIDGNVVTGKAYLGQLWAKVKCQDASFDKLERVRYELSDLEKYFKAYNECMKASPEDAFFVATKKRRLLHLKITPGLAMHQFSVDYYPTNTFIMDFGSQTSWRIGLEGELVLPFNKDKWSIVLEPTFVHYKATKEKDNVKGVAKVSMLDFPMGIRHYFFLRKDTKIFLNAFYIPFFNINFKSQMSFERTFDGYTYPALLEKLDFKSSFALGAGVMYKSLSLEVRYALPRGNHWDYTRWEGKFNSLSLIAGFRFF